MVGRAQARLRRMRRDEALKPFLEEVRASLTLTPEFESLYEMWMLSQRSRHEWIRIAVIIASHFVIFTGLTLLDTPAYGVVFPVILLWLAFSLHEQREHFRESALNVLPIIVHAYFALIYLVASALAIGESFAHEVLGKASAEPLVFLSSAVSPSDILNFAVVTLTTVGYGDIYPVHWLAKLICSIAAIAGVLYVSCSILVVASLVIEGKELRQAIDHLRRTLVEASAKKVFAEYGAELSREFRIAANAKPYFERELLKCLQERRTQ